MDNKTEMSFPGLKVLRNTADLPWRVADQCSTREEEHVIRLRWSQRGIRGWPSAILSLENSLSVWFHRTLQPLLLTAARRKTLCRVNGVWPPELHFFPQPFPSSCALAPVLPQGPCPLTAGLNAILFSEEVVLLSITATIYKVLTVPSLGVVKVSDLWGNAGTWEFMLQAESRPRSCWNGRGNESVMRMVITAWSTRLTTETTCLFAIENVRVAEDGQIEKLICKPTFWNIIMNVAKHDTIY